MSLILKTSGETAPVPAMSGRTRFLAAAAHRRVDSTPIWFMRQAGRSLPEYRALRERYDFLTVAKTPELCVQATLMPVSRLGVDAAVLFADIMLPLDGMGVPFKIEPTIGPVIPTPIRTADDIARLRVIDAHDATPYLFEAIQMLRSDLGESAALLGFSGAPFTLACYLVEGRPSREFPKTKALMYGQPVLWHALMSKLTEVVIRYLRAQIGAGAEAVQLFDSWLGLLDPISYEQHVLPYTRHIQAELKGRAPTIHFSTGTQTLLPLIATSNCDIVSIDWRQPIDLAWQQIGDEVGIQGNLDPALLLAPFDAVAAGARDILRRVDGKRGHIFNLGHGILPETNPDQLSRLVTLVHQETAPKC